MINVRDPESVSRLRPFLVAHRGGVIAPESPENSMRAIERAAEHGYAMVELDVMEAADHEPVLLHDGLYINCGVREQVCNLTSREITAIRYRASDQRVITFAQAVQACARFGMGVMLDKLCRDDVAAPAMSRECLRRVGSLIGDAALASATVAIVDSPWLREHLGDVSLFPIPREDLRRMGEGQAIPLHGHFGFGWAAELPGEAVARLHQAGVFAIVSINTFHYPHHAPHILAQQDIERLLDAGMDGFQIDSMFEDHFPKDRRGPVR